MPSNVVTADVDPATGFLAYYGQEDAVSEQFLDGTVPTEAALPPAADGDGDELGDDIDEPGKAVDDTEGGAVDDRVDSSPRVDTAPPPSAPSAPPPAVQPAVGDSSDQLPPPF